MDGIRRIARAYYERASEEEKNNAKNFFSKLDLNGDGKISLTEFKKTVSSWLSDDEVFKKLDTNSDGALDFSDVLVLVYMVIKGRTFSRCNGCRELIFGPYFSCFLCLCKNPDQTYNLCCDCYRGGKFQHQHPFSNMLHDQALLAKFSQLTTSELKTQEKREMEELREMARSHYRAGSQEVQALAQDFFRSMDSDGDGQVDLPEFLSFMRQQAGYSQLMRNRHFFKELDRDGNGTLDFWEVMTLYYIIKSGRPFCDWCGNFIPGIFFSCVECFKGHESPFNLCRQCYQSTECKHNHNGRTQFLDNYTLLQTKRESALGQAAGIIQNEPRATQARSPIPSNAVVQAPNYTTTTYNAYYVNPPSPSPTYSNAIVPASKMSKASVAFKAFEVALAIGNISSTMCAIL